MRLIPTMEPQIHDGMARIADNMVLLARLDDQYLAGVHRRGRAAQRGSPVRSTWGDGGHFEVWLNGSNDWVYPEVHAAERTMVRLARQRPSASGLLKRALDQCARELMLAQSGDWAFLMCAGTARRYASSRFKAFMGRFRDLADGVKEGQVLPGTVQECERLDDAFAEMDYRLFAPDGTGQGAD